jgi:hypothetical protein
MKCLSSWWTRTATRGGNPQMEGEVCDPVQNNSVIVNGMIFSDWILPKWTDAQAVQSSQYAIKTVHNVKGWLHNPNESGSCDQCVWRKGSAARQGYQIKGEPCLEKKTYLNRNVLSHREHYPESKLQ